MWIRLVVVLLTVAAPLTAQESNFTLNINVDLVELHVSVFDDDDRPVSGLKKDQFVIKEDQIEQRIELFRQEDQPVSLGLVLDNSRSVEPRKERLDAAALAFVRHSNPDDETFIVTFDEEARLAQAFTQDQSALERTLRDTKPFGQTALYDAVLQAVGQMETTRHTKRAILVITDGVDNASRASLDEVLRTVRHAPVAIYTIGLLSQYGGEKAESDLRAIAQAGGGRAYFPQTVQDVRTITEKIARDLREQYTIGYIPNNAVRDGRWRSVRVEVQQPLGTKRLFVNYRHGYYGPADSPR